jgi:CRP-like cAMP-binding protein
MNETRAASIIVTSDECAVLTIQRETFNRLLGNLGDILKRNMAQYDKVLGGN